MKDLDKLHQTVNCPRQKMQAVHIFLYFPTSAKAQSSQNTFEDNPAGLDQNGLGLDFDLDLAELEGNDGADGGLGDLGDLFDVSDDMFGIGEGVGSGADASDDRGHKDGDGINAGIVPTNGSQPGTPLSLIHI